MAVQFMKGQYKIQKYAVNEYFYLFDMIFDYTIDYYELPEYTDEERKKVKNSIESVWQKNYAKEIFANDQIAKRFVKELEKYFANNGSDSFAYTCRCAAEHGAFVYTRENIINEWSKKTSNTTNMRKYYKDENTKIIRIFNPLLDQWANDMALLFEQHLIENREQNQKEELEELERLAKKHGKSFKQC